MTMLPTKPPPHSVLRLALHAMVSERCKQAYLHDLRNGMQGVSGGFEVLKRLLKNAATTAPTPLSIEKSTEMVRRSLTSHEEALKSIVDQLVPIYSVANDGERSALRIDDLLRELAKFLNSDAAAHEISLALTLDDTLQNGHSTVNARPETLRLTLLGLLVDAIDSMHSGGELRLTTRSSLGEIVVDITAIPAQGTLQRNYTTIWQLDLAAERPRDGLLFYVVRQLVEADGGAIDFAQDGNGSKASIRYPLATAL